MKRYVVLDKEIGQTPLEALTAWKAANPAYADTPASYAGRLDPMASGKLLVLLGDECKKQKEYTGLDKEYEIEVLLDAGSDTGDALGLVEYENKETRVDPKLLEEIYRAEEHVYTRRYPVFSSKTVNGKPLFLYALEGTLDTIDIPVHEEEIYRIKDLGAERIAASALKERIEAFLAKTPKSDEESKALGADFRITSVRASWGAAFAMAGTREFTVLKLRVACASGTYMRSLASRLGKMLGSKGLALSIHRTRIGKRMLGFWVKSYS